MNAELSTLATLTPKADQAGVRVKLKVYWKTTKFWTQADIIDFQRSVPAIAEQLRTEEYWNKYGEIKHNKFICEDFAIRILCEYASSKGLPVKLTTGVRTYRNMEMLNNSEHDKYASNKYGFSEMVMRTYGAPDMQRTGINTMTVEKPEKLLSGDILALVRDLKGKATSGRAHHIQVVVVVTGTSLKIYQGNSDDTIHIPITWINRLAGRNAADPQQSAYAGMPIEQGTYTNNGRGGWDYKNITKQKSEQDLLKFFDLFRWNFMEFNK